ncbi:membrane protein [Marinobacterium nitratireducens]|uniref:Membrane protein n=1 Tax=Marinobacterium nitratireducens TaxID=518897 RepID=A0A917Z9V7_9GAMM|nr:YqaA family protein [Marinobacterium nitratireducens]GGO78695.1 membrane protein [Marinobacterium nitratireducens]
MLEYFLLFAGAFAAATILPFYSEVYLAALLMERPEQWPLLWLVATLGNTGGAVVNWWLGRFMLHYQDRRWFPARKQELERAQRWFQRFGVWSLLLAWLPIGGDALTFIGGLMKVRLDLFIALVAIGKGLRYLVVILFADALLF